MAAGEPIEDATSACENGGERRLALWLLGDIGEAQLEPEMISFGVALGECENAGEWQQALVGEAGCVCSR